MEDEEKSKGGRGRGINRSGSQNHGCILYFSPLHDLPGGGWVVKVYSCGDSLGFEATQETPWDLPTSAGGLRECL